MLGGDGLSYSERRSIDAALARAHRFSDFDFEAYLGPAGDNAREQAISLHRGLPRPDQSVLVLCDPDSRALEIVTGRRTRRYLDDGACRFAVASMTSSFLAGDIVGGLVQGIQQLGGAAHHPETMHAPEVD